MSREAVVLLSGGLDSTTVMATAKSQGFLLHALSFNYGQRHSIELERAEAVARYFGASHQTVSVPRIVFQGSALTTPEIAVPKDALGLNGSSEIPTTYVPARNTVFLALALGYGEAVGAFDIFIGANSIDYSGYPDCRGEYLQAFEAMANLALKETVEGRAKVKVHAPLLTLRKEEIIALGLSLGVDYSMTHSCYDPDPSGRSCGRCDSCLLRLAAFAANGIVDPISYVDQDV